MNWSNVHCHFLFLICRIHFSTLVVYCPSFCKTANVCANSLHMHGFLWVEVSTKLQVSLQNKSVKSWYLQIMYMKNRILHLINHRRQTMVWNMVLNLTVHGSKSLCYLVGTSLNVPQVLWWLRERGCLKISSMNATYLVYRNLSWTFF